MGVPVEEMQQYGSTPYCVLPLTVLQYIAIASYMTRFGKRTYHINLFLKLLLAVKVK